MNKDNEILKDAKDIAEENIKDIDKKTKEEFNEVESEKRQMKYLFYAISFIVGLFILFFIVRATYHPEPKLPEYTYNGFKFVKIAGLWNTQWQNGNNLFNIHLRYGPRESENVPYFVENPAHVKNDSLTYITFDPGENKGYVALASAEISLNLVRTFNTTPIAACSKNETSPCYTRPIITCSNTEDRVIYIKEDPETKITVDRNCLIIQGLGEDLVRAADKVIWIWYGIIV
jgi:hypothetical protein